MDKTPNLAAYDVIMVSSSAGKDSQAMLDYVVELAEDAGVRDRLIVVHADLGRMEWLGTKELAVVVEKVAGSFKQTKTLASIIGDVVAQYAGTERTAAEHQTLTRTRDGKTFLKVAA